MQGCAGGRSQNCRTTALKLSHPSAPLMTRILGDGMSGGRIPSLGKRLRPWWHICASDARPEPRRSMTRPMTVGGGSPAPLSSGERRAVRIDAYVKDLLAKERKADELKRQELKALRIAQNAVAPELGT
jgi:hypothetical protein